MYIIILAGSLLKTIHLLLLRKNISKQKEIKEQKLPFETDDIDEMLELIDEKMEDLENESARIKAESIGDDVVPF